MLFVLFSFIAINVHCSSQVISGVIGELTGGNVDPSKTKTSGTSGKGTTTPGGYDLKITYDASNFVDSFNFFTGEVTGGYIEYVTQEEAQRMKMVRTTNNQIYMGADMIGNGGKRKTVKVRSTEFFNTGNLMIMDLDHMPTGCGTWPAWWLTGWFWPMQGEIDMIETVNTDTKVHTTLHTSPGCVAPDGKHCDAGGSKEGCGVRGPPNMVGEPFNKAGGGVWALLWDQSGIKVYSWLKKDIPSDITSGSPKPSTWKAYATFDFGDRCSSSRFTNMNMIINIDFCGGMAGGGSFTSASGCSGSCKDHVSKAANVQQAYWLINSIKIYSTPDADPNAQVPGPKLHTHGLMGAFTDCMTHDYVHCVKRAGFAFADMFGPKPGNASNTVPQPKGVTREVCYKDGCKGTITNPIPLGQHWVDHGQSRAEGCCRADLDALGLTIPSNPQDMGAIFNDLKVLAKVKSYIGAGACRWCVDPLSIPGNGNYTEPTCYFQAGNGNGKCPSTHGWEKDEWGMAHDDSWKSQEKCLARKFWHDQHCGTDSIWCFAYGDSKTCGGPEVSVCHIDGCHGTQTNVLPNHENWQRVLSKSHTGCCAWGKGDCDTCRYFPPQPVLLSENTYENKHRMDSAKKVCWKDSCRGTLTNPVPRGQQWAYVGAASDKGCCAFARGGCDFCVPPHHFNAGKSSCVDYVAKIGCAWTMDWSCPGQPRGLRGVAHDDGSTGYKCCCYHGGHKTQYQNSYDVMGNGFCLTANSKKVGPANGWNSCVDSQDEAKISCQKGCDAMGDCQAFMVEKQNGQYCCGIITSTEPITAVDAETTNYCYVRRDRATIKYDTIGNGYCLDEDQMRVNPATGWNSCVDKVENARSQCQKACDAKSDCRAFMVEREQEDSGKYCCGLITSTTTITAVDTETRNYCYARERPVSSGDEVFLRGKSGKFIHVNGNEVQAGFAEKGWWQTLIIETLVGGKIFHGDIIFLKSKNTGKYIDMESQDKEMEAKFADKGPWQSFIIQRAKGKGTVLFGDAVFLLSAQTLKFVNVKNGVGPELEAKWGNRQSWQQFTILDGNKGIEAKEYVSSSESLQTYSAMISPSTFNSLQYVLAAIGALGLVYGAFNLCFYKNGYYHVPSQEEI